MHVLEHAEMREKDKKREWGLQAKIQQLWHVWLFPPPLLIPSSLLLFQFTPQRTTTWPGYFTDSENNKKDFLGLTFICCGRAEWERKIQRRQGEFSVWSSNVIFLRFLSGPLTFPALWLCLSLTFHLSCWQSHLVFHFVYLLVCPLHLSAGISFDMFTCRDLLRLFRRAFSIFHRLWLTTLTS